MTILLVPQELCRLLKKGDPNVTDTEATWRREGILNHFRMFFCPADVYYGRGTKVPYGSQMFSVKINGYWTQSCMEIRTTRWDDEFLWTDHLVSHQFLSCNDKCACFLQIPENIFRLFKHIQAIYMLNKLEFNQKKLKLSNNRLFRFQVFTARQLT